MNKNKVKEIPAIPDLLKQVFDNIIFIGPEEEVEKFKSIKESLNSIDSVDQSKQQAGEDIDD